MAEFPSFLNRCESSQPLPKPFSLPSGVIKLVRTGFPCEVADASASTSGTKPKEKRTWRNLTEHHKGLLNMNLLWEFDDCFSGCDFCPTFIQALSP